MVFTRSFSQLVFWCRPRAGRWSVVPVVAALALGAACTKSAVHPPADQALGTVAAAPPVAAAAPPVAAVPSNPNETVVPLVIASQLYNTTEACGCTSDPLGDVARLVALVKSSHALLLDAGGLRYDETPTPADKLPQARQKADFLETTWGQLGAITMLQPEDLHGHPDGSELVGHQRLASNVSGLPAGILVGEAVRTVQGVKLGVFGLADPEAAWPPGVQVSEPIAAAQAAVGRLRAQGAQAIVALTGLRREQARRIGRKVSGLQLIVAGGKDIELTAGVDPPELVGETLLVVPGNKGEHVVRLELHVPKGGKPSWTVYPSRRQQEQRVAQLRLKQQAAQARLTTLRADASADPAFLKTSEAEVTRLTTELQTAAAPAAVPPGGFVVSELIPINRALPRDPEVAAAMTALDRRIGAANLAATAGPPPPVAAGQPRYLGDAGCLGACHYHSDSVEFWQKTRHAGAWKTLVDGGKDLSYDCVGCHVVGFDKNGGANLWTLDQWQRLGDKPKPAAAGPDLRNVQCEACHGPGSLHARAPSKVAMPVPKPDAEVCLGCHTKEHSDTFAFDPYLRDILGPGHGEDRRRALGNGPTGHELRSAALKAHAPH